MCGISGIILADDEVDHDWLYKSIKSVSHRGPDSQGIWWSADKNVGLAHRRLSIIDLSPKANQPMTYSIENLVIVFNGEIYNFISLKKKLESKGYIFDTNSDTEVLLKSYHCWGKKCLEYLEGMFVFAIIDQKEKKLFIARDRAGEKPLYYYYNGKKLIFCSELKGILKHENIDRKIDIEAFNCFLSMGFVPGHRCIIRNINKLSPASYLEYDYKNNLLNIEKYWFIPKFNRDSKMMSERELLSELEFLLSKSIKNQLVADVPIGILLSGGIDSSLIAAIAASQRSNIKTYNVRFSNYNEFDESKHAKLISNYFGTDHTEIDIKDISTDILSKLATQYDEPIADSSMIPTYLVCKTVRKHCTVALGGDGGDELFAGYQHYSRLLLLKKIAKLFPSSFLDFISLTSSKSLPLGFKGRNWFISIKDNLDIDVPFIANIFDASSRKNLISCNKLYSENAEAIRRAFIDKSEDIIERATKLDFKLFLAEDLLVKIDRASMLNSLELRSPFLDKNIIEFAYSTVPSCLKSTSSNKKILLKKLCKKILPSNFDLQRKHGFSVPIGNWIKSGEWLHYFKSILYDDGSPFNKDFIEQLIKNQKKGYNNTEKLFALVMFEKWRRQYEISI